MNFAGDIEARFNSSEFLKLKQKTMSSTSKMRNNKNKMTEVVMYMAGKERIKLTKLMDLTFVY